MLVDGGTEWTVFRRLIVPLSKPVLATVSIYDGLNVWNNFILPLVLTQSPPPRSFVSIGRHNRQN
jgi:raffinose/stachyose/melibiose transport system permease protein